MQSNSLHRPSCIGNWCCLDNFTTQVSGQETIVGPSHRLERVQDLGLRVQDSQGLGLKGLGLGISGLSVPQAMNAVFVGLCVWKAPLYSTSMFLFWALALSPKPLKVERSRLELSDVASSCGVDV